MKIVIRYKLWLIKQVEKSDPYILLIIVPLYIDYLKVMYEKGDIM